MRLPFVAPLLVAAGCLLPATEDFVGGTPTSDAGPSDAKADAPSEAAADAGPDARIGFFDDFARADGPAIGNGWIAKKPSVFQLSKETAFWTGTNATVYRDNVVTRPPSEDLADVTVSAVVHLGVGFTTPGYPQIWARLQQATLAKADTLDGYVLYVFNAFDTAKFGRQNGSAFVTDFFPDLTISPPLSAGSTCRLTLEVSGTDPVNVTATVEELVNGKFVVRAKATVKDADPARITSAGTVGFGGAEDPTGSYAYDDFSRVP